MILSLFPPRLNRQLLVWVMLCGVAFSSLQGQEFEGGTIRRFNDELIILNRSETIQANETVRRAVVVAGDIRVDGRIERDLTVVGGSVTLNGEIGGELVLVGGRLISGENALVEGESLLIGGPFDIRSRGTFERGFFELPIPGFFSFLSGAKSWLAYCVLMLRPFSPSVPWTIALAGMLALVNVFTLILLGKVVHHSVTAMAPKPISAFFIGLLGLLLLGPALVLITATGVGILLVPIFLCAFVVAIIIGKVAVYTALGRSLGQRAGMQWEGASLMAFLVGSLLMFLLYMVPVLGGITLGLVIPMAFGSVLMAGFQMFRTEVDFPAPKPAAPLVMPPRAPDEPPSSGATPGSGASNAFGASGFQAGSDAGTRSTPASDPETHSGDTQSRTTETRGQVREFQRAGFWSRLAATGLDFLLVFFGLHLLDFMDGGETFRRFVVIWMLYHILSWGWKGTTVGGLIMRLRLVTLNGERPSWGTAVIRSLSSFFSLIALGLGFIWAGWTPNRQSWHDIIAGTVMIKLPASEPAYA